MKKTYENVEWEITFLSTKDVITASGETYVAFNQDGILDDENMFQWNW